MTLDKYLTIAECLPKEQEPCEDEYIKVPKKALKYRTAGMVVYNTEWLKDHFDMERAVICGAQEPCEDAISRQAAIEKIHWLGLDNDTAIKCDLAIRALSPVKPQPKTGYWKYAKPLQAEICSCCGCIKGNYFFSDIEVPIKFCSNCGAKMESEEQEREGAEC